MIGLKKGIVELAAFTDQWKKLYYDEEKIIWTIIKDYVVDIQHIGSTSISGLDAKPIIDMLIGAKTLDYLPSIIEKLEANGYIYMPEAGTEERSFFVKGTEEMRTHHIHVVQWNEEEWVKHIVFRDYLREHREIAKEYLNLKNRLAVEFKNDRNAYTEGKSEFIQGIIKKAVK